MKLLSLLAVALVIATANGSQGTKPVVTRASFREVPFRTPFLTLTFVEVTLEFDQDLYYRNATSDLVKLSLMPQKLPGIPQMGEAWPRSMVAFQGMMKVCCGSICPNMYGLGGAETQGPTTSFVNMAFGIPNTQDSLYTFFKYFANFVTPSTPDDSKISVAFVLDATFQFGQQTFTFPYSGIDSATFQSCVEANNFTVTYAPGSASCAPSQAMINELEAKPEAAGFTYQPQLLLCEVSGATGLKPDRRQMFNVARRQNQPCRPLAASGLQTDLFAIMASLEKVTNKKQLEAMDNVLSSFTTRQAVQGCEYLINCLINFRDVQVPIGLTYSCPYDFNNASQATLIAADPCCTYSPYKCCKLKPVTRPLKRIVSYQEQQIVAKCGAGNVAAVKSVLDIFQADTTASETDQTQDLNLPELFDELYLNGFQKCQSEVTDTYQSCTSDEDCWSGTCQAQLSFCTSCPRHCEKPSNFLRAMLRCLVSELPQDTVNALFYSRNVTFNQSDRGASMQALVTSLRRQFGGDDCEGPTSYQYKAGAQWVASSSGNYKQVVGPVNATGCLLDKECNYDSFLNQTECDAYATRGLTADFCARCDGTWCREVSEPPQCIIEGVADQAECTMYGGTSYRMEYQWSYRATCFKTPASKYSDCLDTLCPGPNSTNAWIRQQFADLEANPNGRNWLSMCGTSICYSNQNETACNAAFDGRHWDADYSNGAGLCIMYAWVGASQCTAAGMTYYPGAEYRNGRYDTQMKCTSPKCQLPKEYDLVDVPNGAACTLKEGCNMPCEGCTVNPWVNAVDGLCTFAESSPGSCNPNQGSPMAGPNGGICVDEKQNNAQCRANNGTVLLCTQFLNRTSCESNPLLFTMQCLWNWDAPCSTQQCLMQGECNDWDLIDYQSPGCQQSGFQDCGTCVTPFPMLPNNATFSDCNSSLGSNGYPVPYNPNNPGTGLYQTRIGCYTPGIGANDNAANCTRMFGSQGGQFFTRAKTKAQCESPSRGKGCLRPWGDVQNMKEMDCTDCGDRYGLPLYTWTQAQIVFGTVVNLQWIPRGYKSINRIVQNTVPFYTLEQVLERAVTGVVARRYADSIAKKFFAKAVVYVRIACLCTEGRPLSTLTQQRACAVVSGVVRAQRGNCQCGGGSCDQQCPIACDFDCKFTVLVAYLALGGNRRRNLLLFFGNSVVQNNGVSVKNSMNVIVGQTIGQGKQYSGTVPAMYKICLDIDPLITIEPAYTSRDFSKDVNGAPSAPLGFAVWLDGNRLCSNVTTQDIFYPIARLASYTGGSVTARPSASPVTLSPATPLPSSTPSTSRPSTTPTTPNPTQATTGAPSTSPSRAPTRSPVKGAGTATTTTTPPIQTTLSSSGVRVVGRVAFVLSLLFFLL